jgi:transaldolase
MATLTDVSKLGQSIWLDYISRSLLASGELQRLVDMGLRGMTSNPTIFQKSITGGDEYDARIKAILESEPDIDTRSLYDRLVIRDIQMAADILRPVYEETGGIDGLVSLEPPAQLSYDTDATVSEVRRLWKLVDRPNLMMKVPSTGPGIEAVESLIAEGININITLMFSMKHYEDVSAAYIRGISRNPHPKRISSVASFFVSRVDTYADRELEKIGTEEALALRGKAAIANSKLVYRRFREVFSGDEFMAQRRRGARVQRVLWGSTSTKNPEYSDVMYIEGLIGPDTVNTVPMEALEAFLDHGQARCTVDTDIEEAERVMADLAKVGVDIDAITEQLQVDGVKAFMDSYDRLLSALEAKRTDVPV